ncbi:cell envelope-related transcriptional attenuator [Kribbella flavida DSM 17836]|uniref:Cell envelope-related transcriptional attenuator n=1 Tax=Kribbella flavida (strain DSM 17836 / JCM 10339 / NBRC 14399) TaxID=479435 RepID=D2PLM8_KRIFD|nr:LCP family protein [Kribbella flavida]ADB30657.1 cell envelope-related transcriptional attenuator [Kribbella flavida DSM 17836]
MPQEKPDLRTLSEPVRFRRAVALLLMTLVLPGSAQIVAGSKRAGRYAWRVVAGLIALVLFLVLLSLVWRSGTINLIVAPATLRVVQVLLIVLAIGWAALFVDAYRLGRPLTLERNHRLAASILDGVLVVLVVGALVWGSTIVSAQRDFVASVFGSGEKSSADKGRYNVLLLGGDSGANRIGVRPDSITLASIDAETGRAVLIGLPRNMAKVPFPAGSEMAKQFPNGFEWDDCGHNCYLNGVYTWAMGHKQHFPGVQEPGLLATQQAVEGITGLKVNYYVLIDIAGFQHLLNAVGGITVDVGKRVPIGGIGAPIKGYIEPGKNQHLDGYHAMWFARSRANASDYERMTRQKCVMTAMLNQLSPQKVLTKFQGIAAAGKQVVQTNIPSGELGTFTDLALDSKKLPVSSFSPVPPLIKTGDPDFDLIRSKVAEAIGKSEALDRAAGDGDGQKTDTPSSVSPSKKPSTSPGKSGTTPSKPSSDVDDVAQVCKA